MLLGLQLGFSRCYIQVPLMERTVLECPPQVMQYRLGRHIQIASYEWQIALSRGLQRMSLL